MTYGCHYRVDCPRALSAIESLLTPETVVRWERRFTPVEMTESDEQMVVTGHPSGRPLAPRFVFERRDGGLVYRQDGESGS